MAYYGGTSNAPLTRDILSQVLNLLPEEHWYKLKWNVKIELLMSKLHKDGRSKELAKHGHIESLNGRTVDIRYICEYGSLPLFRRIIFRNEPNWNYALIGSCRGGHLKLVLEMIRKGATNLNWCLQAACRGCHMPIVEFLIANGANNWNYGLFGACRGGDINCVNLMIDKGANNWDSYLGAAARGGHL